jgi:hypothetical protein
MGDIDEFEAWKICWEVNMLPCIQLEVPVNQTCHCIFCKKAFCTASSAADGAGYVSIFAIVATRCTSGHEPYAWVQSENGGVCPSCDTDLVLKISQRKQTCWENDCRKFLLVDTDLVRSWAEAAGSTGTGGDVLTR